MCSTAEHDERADLPMLKNALLCRAGARVANDRDRAAGGDMEIVRSIGGMVRRDRHGGRRPLGRATR